MYNEHFGLQQAPFRITPDTRLFFGGGGRGEILEALVYAVVSGEGIVKVVGEVGTGKTMLCRMLEERLPENVEIVYLANPSLQPDDILQAIALEMDLEIPASSNRLKVMHAMQQKLLEKHAGNRQVVVFVEEAQSMPIETLEEIRLLSNLETKREKLLQIVLFGQPELDDNLNRANIRQLKERITHSFYLEPLDSAELKEYVNHRLRAVGYRGAEVFSTRAYRRMARASEGLTRRINVLADKALLAAYAADRHGVTLKDVRKAINDSQFERRRRVRGTALAMCAGVVLVAGAAAYAGLRPLQGISWLVEAPESAAAAREPAPAAAPAEAEPAAGAAPAAEKPAPGEEKIARVASPPPESGGGAEKPEPPRSAAGVAAAYAVALRPEAPADAVKRTGFSPGAGAGNDPETTAGPGTAEKAPKPMSAPVSAGTDLIEDRLAATRSWLENANARHYSIQLLLTSTSQRRHLEAFLERRSRDGELEQVYVYETVIDDRPYLGVLYREFSSYRAARQALDNLPGNLKRLGPFIRNVSDVTSVG